LSLIVDLQAHAQICLRLDLLLFLRSLGLQPRFTFLEGSFDRGVFIAGRLTQPVF